MERNAVLSGLIDQNTESSSCLANASQPVCKQAVSVQWPSENDYNDPYHYLFPSVDPVGPAETSAYIIERHTRFEEYIIGLEDVAMVTRRTNETTWDKTSFYKGPDIEEKFRFFPYKLPAGTSLDVARESSVMALEWGCPSLDDFQWGCVAYETLLLVYAHLIDQKITSDTEKLPYRDIQLIDINSSANVGGADWFSDSDGVDSQNLEIIRDLVTLMRIKLGLSGQDSAVISDLTVPSGFEFGRMGQRCAIHPLDVRYRAVLLLDGWRMRCHLMDNGIVLADSSTFRCWCKRQIHILHTALSFKLWRLSRYLPSSKEFFQLLHGWPQRGPWYRKMFQEDVPRFPSCGKDTVTAKLNVIAFLLGHGLKLLAVVAKAVHAYDATMQLNPAVEDSADSDSFCYVEQALLQLIHLMTCLGSLDKGVRLQLAEEGVAVGRFLNACSDSSKRRIIQEAEPLSCTPSKAVPAEARGTDLEADPCWVYEAPLVHLIMSYLWMTVTDASSVDALHTSSTSLARNLLIVCSVIQGGIDVVSLSNDRMRNSTPASIHDVISLMQPSLQTQALFLVKALWDGLSDTRRDNREMTARRNSLQGISITSYDTSLSLDLKNRRTSTSSTNALGLGNISVRALRTMLHLCDVEGFLKWLRQPCSREAPQTFKRPSHLPLKNPNTPLVDVLENITEKEARVFEKLLEYWPVDPWVKVYLKKSHPCGDNDDTQKALGRFCNVHHANDARTPDTLSEGPSDASESVPERANESTRIDCSTPKRKKKDVFLLNLSNVLRKRRAAALRFLDRGEALSSETSTEIISYQGADTFCTKGETIPGRKRVNESHGEIHEPVSVEQEISLLCSGRIERTMMEAFYCRFITARFRADMVDVLCDYRRRLEPEALPVLLEVWRKVHHKIVGNTTSSQPQERYRGNVDQWPANTPVTEILAGPSYECDVYRYFISQTISRLVCRLFAEARLKSALDKSSVNTPTAPDDVLGTSDNQKEVSVVKLYAQTLNTLIAELRGELVFYADCWKGLLPGNQHAIIVVSATRAALETVFTEFLDGPWWPENDIPLDGPILLQEIRAFEKLVQEVKHCTGTDFLMEPSVVGLFAASVTAALTRRFESMEQTVKRCLSMESWKPVTGQRYSATIVDFVALIHHLLFVMADIFAPVDWVVPRFLQFLRRLTVMLTDALLTGCTNDNCKAIEGQVLSIFDTVLQPIDALGSQRACQWGLLSTLLNDGRVSTSRKGKSAATDLLKPVKYFTKLTKRKKQSKNLSDRVLDASYPVTIALNVNSEENSGDNLQTYAANLVTDKCIPSTRSGHPKKKQKNGRKESVGPNAQITALAWRFGPALTVTYYEIRKYFMNVPLKSCLTRLHNLHFFSEQLPALAAKIKKFTVDAMNERDPDHQNITLSLKRCSPTQEYECRGPSADSPSEVTGKNNILRNLDGLLQNALETCQSIVAAKGEEMCRCIALRLLIYDLGEDFFEHLYHPTFPEYSLNCVLATFKKTVERFLTSSPTCFRLFLRNTVVEYIIKLWCYLLAQMGYHGMVFLPEDMEILIRDMVSLRIFCEHQEETGGKLTHSDYNAFHTIQSGDDNSSSYAETASSLPAANAKHNGYGTLLDRMDEFIRLLQAQPDIFARLGEALRSPLSSPDICASPSIAPPSPFLCSSDEASRKTSCSGFPVDELYNVYGTQPEPAPARAKKSKKKWLRGMFSRRRR